MNLLRPLSPLLALLLLAGCAASPPATAPRSASIDLFSHGLDTPKAMWPTGLADPTAQFLPFSSAVQKVDQGVLLRIADAAPKTTEQANGRYLGLGPFRLRPSTRYRLLVESSQVYNQAIRFWIIFRRGQTEGLTPLLPLGSLTDSGRSTYARTFITPAQVDNAIIWLRIEPTGNNKLHAGTAALLSHARIEELGPVPVTPQARPFYGKNLLAVADFQAAPPGQPDDTALRLVNNPHWKEGPYQAQIVRTEEGTKALKVAWKPGLYPYVHFKSDPAPFYNNSARFTVRIRGHGAVKLGLWWVRQHLPYFYQHERTYELSGQWQEISIASGCAEPLTQSAAASISCVGKEPVEFEISNLSLVIEPPGGSGP